MGSNEGSFDIGYLNVSPERLGWMIEPKGRPYIYHKFVVTAHNAAQDAGTAYTIHMGVAPGHDHLLNSDAIPLLNPQVTSGKIRCVGGGHVFILNEEIWEKAGQETIAQAGMGSREGTLFLGGFSANYNSVPSRVMVRFAPLLQTALEERGLGSFQVQPLNEQNPYYGIINRGFSSLTSPLLLLDSDLNRHWQQTRTDM